uniref:FtsJ RNA 2'-O-methyltransferase 3 n=1 Tax=Macaca fascicularis TaxID=9541 RepID=A0A7N9CBQ8_MACFA
MLNLSSSWQERTPVAPRGWDGNSGSVICMTSECWGARSSDLCSLRPSRKSRSSW